MTHSDGVLVINEGLVSCNKALFSQEGLDLRLTVAELVNGSFQVKSNTQNRRPSLISSKLGIYIVWIELSNYNNFWC